MATHEPHKLVYDRSSRSPASTFSLRRIQQSKSMVWKFDGSSQHHRAGSPVLVGCQTKGLQGVSDLLRRTQMNWTSQFLPKEGYWLKRNADGTEELIWLYNVSGVWCAASKIVCILQPAIYLGLNSILHFLSQLIVIIKGIDGLNNEF